MTINKALVRYMMHVDSYYVEPDGSKSGAAVRIKFIAGYLTRLFGGMPLVQFSPPHLKALRSEMNREDRARKSVNKAVILV